MCSLAGESLFAQGESFRLENLQLLSADTPADALKNYANFNDGEWYNAFCADYDGIDADGYCPPRPGSDPTPGERPQHPARRGRPVPGGRGLAHRAISPPRAGRQSTVPVETGGQGVLAAATEIANVHLIFGNEYLVDATDYRFSTAGIPNADQIIAQELAELAQAQRQFELVMDLVFRAFNDWGVREILHQRPVRAGRRRQQPADERAERDRRPATICCAQSDRKPWRSTTRPRTAAVACKSWPWRSWPRGPAPRTCATAAMRC